MKHFDVTNKEYINQHLDPLYHQKFEPIKHKARKTNINNINNKHV